MSTELHRTVLPTGLLAALLLVSGCTGSEKAPASADRTSSSAPSTRSSPSSALPDGIVKPGTARPVGDGSWTVTLQGFEQLPTGTVPGVPAGSSAYAARVSVANLRSQIATAPRTAVTARYGALGRQAAPAAGTPASQGNEPLRVRPNDAVEQDVRFILPDQAQGQPVTVTVEATEEGLAEPELLFFEGTLPGRRAASPATQGPQGAEDRQGTTPLGQWTGGLRLSKVSVTGQGASRHGRLELSVVNRSGDPMTSLGTTLRILTGPDLHLAATASPAYGYPDAAIAPYRTATQTVSFRVPESAVGGPVTVEAVGVDGSRVPFEGVLRQ